jgi:hypothetical protein
MILLFEGEWKSSCIILKGEWRTRGGGFPLEKGESKMHRRMLLRGAAWKHLTYRTTEISNNAQEIYATSLLLAK